jgi:HlyD family secretion protein
MKHYILLFVPVLFWSGCTVSEEPEPEVVVQVGTAPVERRDVQVTVTAPATFYPRNVAQIAARLTAPVETMETHMGDAVRQGQVLARLASADLETQRAEAAAQVVSAQANYEKVSAGTLPGDVERARGQVETAAAALAEAEKTYQRRQTLFAEGAIPERDLITSKTQYEQAQTTHRVAQRSLDLLLNSSREQDLRMAKSQLDQANARLAYIETQLGFAVIRSPFDGTITQQFLYPGDMAKPDSPIFTVMDLATAVARTQVPADRATSVRQGQSCRFQSIDAPDRQFGGQVTVVNQAVNPAQRSVEVWCTIPNSDGRLKGGTFGQVSVITATHSGAATAPLAAVQLEEGKPEGVAWVAGEDGKAHERKVTTGSVSNGWIEVLSGLQPGEAVVTEGGFGLSDGMAVKKHEAAGQETSK